MTAATAPPRPAPSIILDHNIPAELGETLAQPQQQTVIVYVPSNGRGIDPPPSVPPVTVIDVQARPAMLPND